jgi:TIR domain
MATSSESYDFDVCLSFAGEDRAYVSRVARALHRLGVRVFYDEYEKVSLWGKDLYEHLNWLYKKAARFCVLFASEHYAAKVWTNHERRAAQARALEENREYILPVRFDDTEIPGLNKTISYIDLREVSSAELARLIRKKLGPPVRRNFLPPDPDRLYDALGAQTERQQEEVRSRSTVALARLTRMTQEERVVLFHVFHHSCPSELPENVHLSLDLLRRETGLPPSELVSILRGLASLGFETELRDEDEEHGESDIIVVQWHDMTVSNDEYGDGMFGDGNATLLLSNMIDLELDNFCFGCTPDALQRFAERLDFSALSTATLETRRHLSGKGRTTRH